MANPPTLYQSKLYFTFYNLNFSFPQFHNKNQQNDMCAQRRLRSACAPSHLCTQRIAKDPGLLRADSEDSDQTGQLPRLIWVFTGHTSYFVGFVILCLVYTNLSTMLLDEEASTITCTLKPFSLISKAVDCTQTWLSIPHSIMFLTSEIPHK